MTKWQRIRSILFALIMILTAWILLCLPDGSYIIIVLMLAAGMVISGLGELSYYFMMARFMVGGRLSLLKGVLLFDAGMFTASLTRVPPTFVLIYLIALHAFSGLVKILEALESKRSGAKSWKLKFSHGIMDHLVALACIIFISKPSMAVIIYSIGLIYSAILRIISACRKTAFVYIS